MGLSRVTPTGWIEETGALSRVTPFGWVQESQSSGTSNHDLTPNGTTSGVPSVGSPSITQEHALTANAITSGIPTVGQPEIPTESNHSLTAADIASGAPVVGSPALTAVTGILGADIPSEGEHGGSPVLNDFTIDPAAQYYWEVETAPSSGVLEIFSDLTFTWDAAGVADGDYTWVYRLWEDGVTVGTATVYMHVGALVPLAITAGAPVIGTPALSVSATDYQLTANAITSGIPALGTPSLTEIQAGTMSAENITAGAPTLGTPTITQNHALGAGAIAAGTPVFGPVTLQQQHALMAVGVTAGVPVLGRPIMSDGALPLYASAPSGSGYKRDMENSSRPVQRNTQRR